MIYEGHGGDGRDGVACVGSHGRDWRGVIGGDGRDMWRRGEDEVVPVMQFVLERNRTQQKTDGERKREPTG